MNGCGQGLPKFVMVFCKGTGGGRSYNIIPRYSVLFLKLANLVGKVIVLLFTPKSVFESFVLSSYNFPNKLILGLYGVPEDSCRSDKSS